MARSFIHVSQFQITMIGETIHLLIFNDMHKRACVLYYDTSCKEYSIFQVQLSCTEKRGYFQLKKINMKG